MIVQPIPPNEPTYCAHCRRQLFICARWLELNSHTGRWADDGSIPEKQSQGWFPFGLACAARRLRQQERKS